MIVVVWLVSCFMTVFDAFMKLSLPILLLIVFLVLRNLKLHGPKIGPKRKTS